VLSFVAAQCIHFKHPIFTWNEEIGQLLPFAVLKIKPARFLLRRDEEIFNWREEKPTGPIMGIN
jgi:hypothetical protein